MKSLMFRVLFAPTLLLMVLEARLLGQDASHVLSRHYYVDVQFFSLIPDEGIDSYRFHGSGAGAINASIGLNVIDDRRQFGLTVKVRGHSGEIVATLRVEPEESDERTEGIERELVLSDLQPQTVEIARNDDGRVYQLQLFPKVRELHKPRAFDTKKLRLDHWTFRRSPVILNDQDYLGRLQGSSGQLAFLDMPGLAKVEFSLLPFRDAKPLGSLKDGVVQITHESGTSLLISDVENGYQEVLTGGPYQVFVRWSEPSMNDAEYRKSLEETIADVKKQIESGDLPAENNWLQRLERVLDSDRVMMMSNGLGPIPAEDLIQSE